MKTLRSLKRMMEKAYRSHLFSLEPFTVQGDHWLRMVLTHNGQAVSGIHYLSPVIENEDPLQSMLRRLLDGALNEGGLHHHSIDPIVKDIVFTAASIAPFFKNKSEKIDLFSKKGRTEIEYLQLSDSISNREMTRSDMVRMSKSGKYEKKALISLDKSNTREELAQCIELLSSEEDSWRMDERIAAISERIRPVQEYDVFLVKDRSYAFKGTGFIEIPEFNIENSISNSNAIISQPV